MPGFRLFLCLLLLFFSCCWHCQIVEARRANFTYGLDPKVFRSLQVASGVTSAFILGPLAPTIALTSARALAVAWIAGCPERLRLDNNNNSSSTSSPPPPFISASVVPFPYSLFPSVSLSFGEKNEESEKGGISYFRGAVLSFVLIVGLLLAAQLWFDYAKTSSKHVHIDDVEDEENEQEEDEEQKEPPTTTQPKEKKQCWPISSSTQLFVPLLSAFFGFWSISVGALLSSSSSTGTDVALGLLPLAIPFWPVLSKFKVIWSSVIRFDSKSSDTSDDEIAGVQHKLRRVACGSQKETIWETAEEALSLRQEENVVSETSTYQSPSHFNVSDDDENSHDEEENENDDDDQQQQQQQQTRVQHIRQRNGRTITIVTNVKRRQKVQRHVASAAAASSSPAVNTDNSDDKQEISNPPPTMRSLLDKASPHCILPLIAPFRGPTHLPTVHILVDQLKSEIRSEQDEEFVTQISENFSEALLQVLFRGVSGADSITASFIAPSYWCLQFFMSFTVCFAAGHSLGKSNESSSCSDANVAALVVSIFAAILSCWVRPFAEGRFRNVSLCFFEIVLAICSVVALVSAHAPSSGAVGFVQVALLGTVLLQSLMWLWVYLSDLAERVSPPTTTTTSAENDVKPFNFIDETRSLQTELRQFLGRRPDQQDDGETNEKPRSRHRHRHRKKKRSSSPSRRQENDDDDHQQQSSSPNNHVTTLADFSADGRTLDTELSRTFLLTQQNDDEDENDVNQQDQFVQDPMTHRAMRVMNNQKQMEEYFEEHVKQYKRGSP